VKRYADASIARGDAFLSRAALRFCSNWKYYSREERMPATTELASARAQERRPQLLIPGLAGFYEWIEPYAYPLMRFAIGAAIVPIGWWKLQGGMGPVVATMAKYGIEPTGPAAFCVIAIESLGGLCIALGFLTRFWAAAFAIELAAITATKIPNGYYPVQPFLLWGILAFAVALRGGGRCSIDRLIGWEL
jgi:putative oxidoreductase